VTSNTTRYCSPVGEVNILSMNCGRIEGFNIGIFLEVHYNGK
jgi:hypothetical protein